MSGDGQMVTMPVNSAQYQLLASTPVTSPSEPLSMFISEARIQNTEMRMNMTRIIDKIDTLATKVGSCFVFQTSHFRYLLSSCNLDGGIVYYLFHLSPLSRVELLSH